MRKVWDQVPSGTCARRVLTAPDGPAGLERKTGGFGMKKELIALGAALALVGTLTACSSTPADQNKGSASSGATGSTTGSAAGTAYPRSTRYGMNGTAGGHGYTYDGRYTAFPDGRVAPGRGNAAQDMDRVGKGVADGTRDLVNGVGDVVRDAGNGLRDAGQAVKNAADRDM